MSSGLPSLILPKQATNLLNCLKFLHMPGEIFTLSAGNYSPHVFSTRNWFVTMFKLTQKLRYCVIRLCWVSQGLNPALVAAFPLSSVFTESQIHKKKQLFSVRGTMSLTAFPPPFPTVTALFQCKFSTVDPKVRSVAFPVRFLTLSPVSPRPMQPGLFHTGLCHALRPCRTSQWTLCRLSKQSSVLDKAATYDAPRVSVLPTGYA